jgi:hypothetical protein
LPLIQIEFHNIFKVQIEFHNFQHRNIPTNALKLAITVLKLLTTVCSVWQCADDANLTSKPIGAAIYGATVGMGAVKSRADGAKRWIKSLKHRGTVYNGQHGFNVLPQSSVSRRTIGRDSDHCVDGANRYRIEPHVLVRRDHSERGPAFAAVGTVATVQTATKLGQMSTPRPLRTKAGICSGWNCVDGANR